MKTVYACRWDKFVAWFSTKQVNLLHDKLSEILLFVLSLGQQGLALGTVKGYLSVISPLRLPDQPSLFKSPVAMLSLIGLQHISTFSFHYVRVGLEFSLNFSYVFSF